MAGYVIVLRGRADEKIQASHEAVEQFLGRGGDAGLECAQQTRLIEFFVASVNRFDQPSVKMMSQSPGPSAMLADSYLASG